jgi:hypothetical protein
MNGTPDEDPLTHMRQRIEMCRRLAKSTTDERTATVLREMAEQAEMDLNKLLAEREARHS